jgi:hypothetical protein
MPETLQDDWTEDSTPPPAKKGLPSWLLFCGGGCLITMILGVVGVYFIYDTFKDVANPEVQWAELEKAIPMDARPNDLKMGFGGGLAGTDGWFLSDGNGQILFILAESDASAEDRNAAFSDEMEGSGLPGVSEISDVNTGEIMVQGRVLPISRFTANSGGQTVPSCMVDITPEGALGYVMANIQRPGQKGKNSVISDDDIRDLLKAFIIGGPDREIYVPDGPHPQAGKTSMDLESFGQGRESFEYELDPGGAEEPMEEVSPDADSSEQGGSESQDDE